MLPVVQWNLHCWWKPFLSTKLWCRNISMRIMWNQISIQKPSVQRQHHQYERCWPEKDGTYTVKVKGKSDNAWSNQRSKRWRQTDCKRRAIVNGVSKFNVLLSDFNVAIPSLVKDKVASEVKNHSGHQLWSTESKLIQDYLCCSCGWYLSWSDGL